MQNNVTTGRTKVRNPDGSLIDAEGEYLKDFRAHALDTISTFVRNAFPGAEIPKATLRQRKARRALRESGGKVVTVSLDKSAADALERLRAKGSSAGKVINDLLKAFG